MGAEATQHDDDGEAIGVNEARAAVKQNHEMEEAKAELQDLKGSDDEAGYGEGAGQMVAEGSESLLAGHKRSRDEAQNQGSN